MKLDIITLAVVAAVFVAASAGCNWLLATYAPDLTPAHLFMDADPIAKLVMITLVLLAFPIMVLGVIGVLVRSAAAPMAMILRIAALTSSVLGMFAATYSWMNIQTAISRIGPVRIEVTAPSYAEALLVLAWGTFLAAVALALTIAARLRAGPRPKA